MARGVPTWQALFAGAACVGLLVQQPAWATERVVIESRRGDAPAAEVPSAGRRDATGTMEHAVDVELSPTGRFEALVRDAQGTAAGGVAVRLHSSTGTFLSGRTDDHGRVVFSDVAPGAYVLVASTAAVRCRIWANGTAPPSAQRTAKVVVRRVVRAQIGPPLLGDSTGLFGLSPLWSLAVVAAAIAIPVGIAAANGDDNPPPASP
ncbi:MAG: carboxypeptidase regulatory-like domain-containing protein [Planctomycetota bacterium]|nr:MAG: carboxypeptidase regulatory-like domain-containing protein [Planctomycetota bacterium]